MGKNRNKAMALIDDGLVNCKNMLRDAINWMNEDEVADFLEKNGYVEEEEEEDDE